MELFLVKLPRKCFSLFRPFSESPPTFSRDFTRGQKKRAACSKLKIGDLSVMVRRLCTAEDKMLNKYWRSPFIAGHFANFVFDQIIGFLLNCLFYCFFMSQWTIFQSYMWPHRFASGLKKVDWHPRHGQVGFFHARPSTDTEFNSWNGRLVPIFTGSERLMPREIQFSVSYFWNICLKDYCSICLKDYCSAYALIWLEWKYEEVICFKDR